MERGRNGYRVAGRICGAVAAVQAERTNAPVLRTQRTGVAGMIEDYYRPLTVRSVSRTVDAYGDAVPTLGAARTILGHVGQPSSAQAARMSQQGVDIAGRLYTSAESAVQAFDVITDDDGRSYQVQSNPRDAARRGHHVEADLTEWRGVV